MDKPFQLRLQPEAPDFAAEDDLLETVRERLVSEYDATYPLPTEANRPVDWPSLADWQAEAFIDFVVSHRSVGETVFHSDFARRRPLEGDALLRLAAIIRAGQEAGAFGAVDPDPTARLLFTAIHEAANAVAGGADRAAILAALQTLLRRALAP